MRVKRLWWMIALMGLWMGLAACSVTGAAPTRPAPAAHAALEATNAPSPSVTAMAALPTLTPPAPTSTATPVAIEVVPSACTDTQGAVASIKVPSPTLRYDIDTRLYLPPCYESDPTRRYPVLYLLHGLNFTEDQWERVGVITATNDLIASGEIAPLIIVMPRDRRDDRLDPAFVADLIPYIDSTYRTVNQRAARAIGGLSRGGGWAVHLGLKYPETFGRIGLHSPAVFYEDELSILDWARTLKDEPKPAIYIDTGETDATIRSPVWLDQVLTWFKVDHTFLIQPGGHSEKYWSGHVRDYLRFYAAGWRGATFWEDVPWEASSP
jgi:enterochelin esterase-like enzyme